MLLLIQPTKGGASREQLSLNNQGEENNCKSSINQNRIQRQVNCSLRYKRSASTEQTSSTAKAHPAISITRFWASRLQVLWKKQVPAQIFKRVNLLWGSLTVGDTLNM